MRNYALVGSGSATLAGPSNDAFVEVNLAGSALDVFFTLARPTPFRLRGTLASTSDNSGSARVDLDDIFIDDSTMRFDHRGILQPGFHSFFALATAGDEVGGTLVGRSSFDIDFSLGAATPEPATLALLATGLAAAVVSRRRTRQQGS